MRITRIGLPVSDAEEAERFYHDVVQLPTNSKDGVIHVGIGRSVLVLTQQPIRSGAHHAAITIPSDRFDEAKRWLQQRVPLLQHDGEDTFRLGPPWSSQSVYFTGPDGILLELIARSALPATSTADFTARDLLCISEIGLAVGDVTAAVARVQEGMDLPAFGDAGPEFTPLGDADGLLVVVRRERPWFPTADVLPSEDDIDVTIGTPTRSHVVALRDGHLEVS